MSYLGPLGSVLPIKCPSAQSSSVERPVSSEVTAGGKRKGFLGKGSPRSWSLDIGAATPSELSALSYLAEHGKQPYVWLSPEAVVSNILSPKAAAFASGTYLGATEGALVEVEPGVWAKSINPTSTTTTLSVLPGTSSSERIPVVQGVPMTVSAYVKGTGVALVVGWRDLLGSAVGGVETSSAVTSADWLRHPFTIMPPSTAAYMTLQVTNASSIAGPAVSLTDSLTAYGPGAGCLTAMVSGLQKAIIMATEDQQYQSASFTVLELG